MYFSSLHLSPPSTPLPPSPPQGYHVHLGEAALELWGEVLRHATTMTPDLMTLFRNMGGVLGVGLPAGDSGRSIAGLLGTRPLPLGTHPLPLGTRPLPLGTRPLPLGTRPPLLRTHPLPLGTHPRLGICMSTARVRCVSIGPDMEMECLQRAFEVVDSYLLLDGVSILQVRPRADLNGHTHTHTHTYTHTHTHTHTQHTHT